MQQQFAAEAQKKGMTPQEFANWQRQQLTADAAKHGLSVEQYVEKLKAQALQQHQQKLAQQQQQQQQQQQSQQQHAVQQEQGQENQHVPINPAAPDPSALALAKWLRGQDLKSRTCILNGQRKDMFKGWSLYGRSNHPSSVSTNLLLIPSKARPPSSPIPRIPKGILPKVLPPPLRYVPVFRSGDFQAPSPLSPGTKGHQD